MAAAYVHRHSARCSGPFYTLDCTALTEALFESEVFGHERGAFTGSVGEKRGLFELADKGTLFLDEIGELSAPLQAKLLRVLETGEFRRVGGVKTRRANVRIVCATNRDLRGTKWFRSDLYYRIACVTVRLPSLRERQSDIPQLARELLKRIGRSAGQRFSIDDDALRLLQTHEYPGNVRELRNILWVAAVNSPDRHVSAELIETALPDRPPVYPRTDGGVQERAQGDRGTGAANMSVERPATTPPPAVGARGPRPGTEPAQRKPASSGRGARCQRADHLPQAAGVRTELTAWGTGLIGNRQRPADAVGSRGSLLGCCLTRCQDV